MIIQWENGDKISTNIEFQQRIIEEMEKERQGKSQHERRKPTDNEVIKGVGEEKEYKHHIVEPRDSKTWYLDGKRVGSLSNLSKSYTMNVETHDIGFDL